MAARRLCLAQPMVEIAAILTGEWGALNIYKVILAALTFVYAAVAKKRRAGSLPAITAVQ